MSPESLRQIYEEHMKADFPEDELRSLSMLLEKQAEGITVAYGWKREGRLYAYAILTQPEQKQPYGEDSYVLLDYYAVCRGFRGQGVGSVFLETLLEGLVCKGVLFEVEDPEAAGRGRKDKNLWGRLPPAGLEPSGDPKPFYSAFGDGADLPSAFAPEDI